MDLADLFFGDNPISQYSQGPITDFISAILPNVYTIIGIILLIYLLVGGFFVVTSGSDQHNLDQGKQIITNAIIGFIVTFASYWIIQIVEVVSGVRIL